MITLEKVNQLKSEGKTDSEIIQTLQEQGYNPKDIYEGLNQARIKKAINPGENLSPSMMPYEETNPPTPSIKNQEQMPYEAQPSQETYSQESYAQQDYYNPNQNQREQSYEPQAVLQPPMPPQENYSQDYPERNQNYEEYQGYAQTYGSADTIIEISEQVFSEKTKLIEKQIKELLEFKAIYQDRINDMNERIKRIEKYFDRMQIAIMEKVSTFGRNIDSLQKEITMVEDSFSKVVNPLTDTRHHPTTTKR